MLPRYSKWGKCKFNFKGKYLLDLVTIRIASFWRSVSHLDKEAGVFTAQSPPIYPREKMGICKSTWDWGEKLNWYLWALALLLLYLLILRRPLRLPSVQRHLHHPGWIIFDVVCPRKVIPHSLDSAVSSSNSDVGSKIMASDRREIKSAEPRN